MVKLSRLVMFNEGFGDPAELRTERLARIRLIAIRHGVWFRVLNRIDRGLLNLAVGVTEKIRSKVLAKAVCAIVRKLLEAFESKVNVLMRRVGAPLAKKLSMIAQGWGHIFARNWSSDKSFVRFLAVMHMNNPEVFKP